MKWENVPFGSLYQQPSRNGLSKPSRVRGSGLKMVNMGELFAHDRIFDIPMELVPVTEKELSTSSLEQEDLLFARQSLVLEGAGKCSIVKEITEPTVFESHLIRVRLDSAKALPEFYYYYFKSPLSPIKSIVSQCAQAGIKATDLAALSVACPPLPVQKKIAEALALYDSLIENNRRQIKLLEEAAQRLYKEWFVDLRFPGHEHTPIVNGIPQGWRKCLLPDFAEILYGYPFNGKLFNSNGKGKPIVRIRNVPSGVSDDYTTEQAPDAYVVKNGDVLVGMDGEFHMNTWSGGDAYLVQRTCCIRPVNEIAKGYLLQALYAPIKFFEKTLVGATVAHLGKKHLDSIELLLPDRDSLLLPFMELTKQRQTLLSENVILTEARDRLLPKLMSGEVEV